MMRPQGKGTQNHSGLVLSLSTTVSESVSPCTKDILDLGRTTLLGNMTSSNPDQRLEHLLSAVESEFQKGSEKGDASERDIKLTLDDADLWIKFKELTNEMIVTKTGR